MPKYKMPTISVESVTYEPVPGLQPPSSHPGYVRDKTNPWRQVSEWNECRHRQITARQRGQCGRALITKLCQCDECPLKGMIVKPENCDFCEYAEP